MYFYVGRIGVFDVYLEAYQDCGNPDQCGYNWVAEVYFVFGNTAIFRYILANLHSFNNSGDLPPRPIVEKELKEIWAQQSIDEVYDLTKLGFEHLKIHRQAQTQVLETAPV